VVISLNCLLLSMNSTNETLLFDRFLIMYDLCVFTCIIFIFVFRCTRVRMSYVLNSYLLTYLLVTLCSGPDGADCLHAAVSNNLKTVVESLCQRGASLDARDSSKEPAVWQALTAGAYEVADVLVDLWLLVSSF